MISPKTEFVLMEVALVFFSALGAWASKYVRDGGLWLVYLIPGLLCIGSWTLMARRSPYSLLTTSIAYDVVYNVVWVIVTAYLLREAVNIWQVSGALVVVAGLVLMGVGTE